MPFYPVDSQNLRWAFIFIISFIGMALCYDFQHIIFLPPYSTHIWRQADCTSQALNYFQDGMHFFSPRIHNAMYVDSNTVGEFPILYYISAALYHWFGPEDWILRSVDLSLYFLGLYALFIMAGKILNDRLTALCFSLLFFSSPLLVFYGFNFLPNIPALGLVFIAWLFFYYYYERRTVGWFYAMNAVFLLAGLLKPTILLSWVAVGCLWLWELLRYDVLRKETHTKKLFQNRLTAAPAFLIVIISVAAWRIWSDAYNTAHVTNGYFLATIMPIWNATPKEKEWIYHFVTTFWSKSYFWAPTHFAILFLSVANLIFYKKQNSALFAIFILTMLGVASYGLLWFQQFAVHDYYATDAFIFPAASFLLFFSLLKNNTGLLKNWAFRTALVLFLIGNIIHTRWEIVDHRYKNGEEWTFGWNTSMYKTKALRQFLANNGVSPKDTVISFSDPTPNVTLYMMNVRGYTDWNLRREPLNKWMKEHIEQKNCKYIVLTKWADPIVDTLKMYLPAPMAHFDSIYLYRASAYKFK